MSTKRYNQVRRLGFSGRHIEAKCVEEARDYPIEGSSIVINPHIWHAYSGETPKTIIPPLSSVILKDTYIEQAALLLLLEVKEATNIGNIILEPGWDLYGKIVGTPPSCSTLSELAYPKDTPLWRSPQENLSLIEWDPSVLLNPITTPKDLGTFLIKVNLWFAPSQTHCFIHNKHDFIEIHSQIFGHGRMQKFKAQDYATLYEEIPMSPGYTTPLPFCHIKDNRTFVYPWHQYYTETDCIWLAIEYHPAGKQ